MKNITLIIPAKNESESLPIVLKNLKKFRFKILVVLQKTDKKTIDSIKKFNVKIIYQTNNGYGDALIKGINNCKSHFFCIFNADGSFRPKEINKMYKMLINQKYRILIYSKS